MLLPFSRKVLFFNTSCAGITFRPRYQKVSATISTGIFKAKRILGLCLLLLVIPQVVQAQAFTDISDTITNPTSDSRSVNFFDLNNDGWDDLYISNGLQDGQNDLLYLNDGTGQLIQVTDMAIVQASFPSDGASFADFDNDGNIDAVVSSWYGAEDLLYLNDGAGTLNYKGNAGIVSGSFAETATFGDFDNDGWVDLYVTNSGMNANNYLYRNLKNGSFAQLPNHPLVNEEKLSRGAIWGDFNNDGITDLFVANESSAPNDLYFGTGAGAFERVTEGVIATDRRSTITASWGDIDNDGDLDLFAGNSNFFRPLADQLYLNLGDGTFEAVADDPIISANTCSFGSAFADYDNDGDLDLVVSNGFCNANLANTLFQNQGDGTFLDVSTELEGIAEVCSFGVAWGDINNDGFQDLAFANCQNSATSSQEENSIFLNQANNNNWLKLQLEGVSSNKNAIGARVQARAVINGVATWQLRDIQAQTGYAGQNSMVVHFGLGDAATVDSLIIHWPAGNRQIFTDIDANQKLEVVEVININTEAAPIIESSISFEVYPNPVTDTAAAKIRLVNKESTAVKNGRLRLYTITGQEVFQRQIQIPPGTSVLSLDTTHRRLSAGVYQVVLEVDNKRFSHSLTHR